MNQLSLPIQEFYQALSVDDRQYAQEQAQEIKLIAHNASIQIGLKLIKVKERLGHGKFGDWIKLEFDWQKSQAAMMMTIAREFEDLHDSGNLPTAKKSAYALASAMSKEDEEGKQEILNAYQEKLTEKQNQAIEEGNKAIEEAQLTGKDPKIPKVPNALTEAQIKEIIAERDRLKSSVETLATEKSDLESKNSELGQLVSNQKTLIDQATQKAEKHAQMLESANALLQEEAERIAELKTKELAEKYTQELTEKLTEAQESAEASLKDAEDGYKKALEKFKANPDPETKKELEELQTEKSRIYIEMSALKRRLEDARSTGENRAAMVSTVANFFGLFENAVKAHPNILIAVASPLVDDAHADRMEDMADFLEEFAGKIRKALADRQFNQATHVEAVDVEIVQDDEDMEDF